MGVTMTIGPVSAIEEKIDIVADDHPWVLILITILIAGLLGIGFFTYFWPVISGQPEYAVSHILQATDIIYDVSLTKPIRVEPDGETEYELLVEIEQNSVLSTEQQVTITVQSLSPFVKLVSDSQNSSVDTRSFSVAPLTSEPQRFSHSVSFVVSRPASHMRTLPVEIRLRYDGRIWIQKVDLEVDYWSKLVVYLVTGSTFGVFVAFAVRVVRSLAGI